MPEKATALKEMARVLAPGGRIAISVWKSQSPLGAALGKVLDGHFGEGTTASWQAVYALGNRDELRALATNAGLRDAHVRFDIKMSRHAEPETFISGAIAGSPARSKTFPKKTDPRSCARSSTRSKIIWMTVAWLFRLGVTR